MIHTPVMHLPCGTMLRVTTAAGGDERLECARCGTVGILAHPPVRLSGDATAEKVMYYLAEHYEVDLLDAVILVGRHLPTVFAGIEEHRPLGVVGDELAARAGVTRRR